MTKQVQRRRGTATQHTSFTGAEGELSVNTTNKSVHVHDNVTAGGFEAARADMDNVTSSSILTAAGITATTAELNYVDGVTSAIQTQLDGKAGTASPTFTGTLTTANLTATGTTTLAGASTSADITFGDNDKAIFGAGSDLQIYHDGGNNYVDAAGVGHLYLQSQGDDKDVKILSDDGSGGLTEYFRADGSIGKAQMFYYGTKKLESTSIGIDVTGTVTADSLTVDGNATISSNSPTLVLEDTVGAAQDDARLQVGASIFNIKRDADNLNRLTVGLSTGDISFYEDTGTTAKFFWDASAENITINHEASSLNGLAIKNDTSTGTTTGAGLTLHAHDGTSVNQIGGIFVSNSTWNYGTYSPKQLSITGSGSGGVRVATVVAPITFHTGNSNAGLSTERMRIDSSGNVGIGSASDGAILQLDKASSSYLDIQSDSTLRTRIYNDSSQTILETTTNNLIFKSASSEAMRISSAGTVTVGKTAEDIGTAGHAFAAQGYAFHTRSGNTPLFINRLTSDGTLAEFRKDGSTVGSISTLNGMLAIGNNNVFLNIDGGAGDYIYPMSSASGGASDGNVTLGFSSRRFKDFYLSGTAYVDTAVEIHAGNSLKMQNVAGNGFATIQNAGAGTNTDLSFNTAGSERMRIDSSGNVGIGTSSQTEKLTVSGAVASIYQSNNFALGDYRVQMDIVNSTKVGRIGTISGTSTPSGSQGTLTFLVNNSEKMRINTGGNVGIGTSNATPSNGEGLCLGSGSTITRLDMRNTTTGDATGDGTSLQLNGNNFIIENREAGYVAVSTSLTERMRIASNGSITMPDVYTDTTAAAANLHISSAGGQLFRSTSSARYKNTIANASFGIVELMALRPVTYKGNNDGDTVFGGLIAEEVHDAGLVEFVQYNQEGEPDALAYGNMVSLCIKAIQEQQATITALTDRITALENA